METNSMEDEVGRVVGCKSSTIATGSVVLPDFPSGAAAPATLTSSSSSSISCPGNNPETSSTSVVDPPQPLYQIQPQPKQTDDEGDEDDKDYEDDCHNTDEDDNDDTVLPKRRFQLLDRPFQLPGFEGIFDSYPYLRYLRLLIVIALVGFAFMVLVLWFGMLYEQAQVRKGPDMSPYYQTPRVCVIQKQQQQEQRNNTITTASIAIDETFLTIQTLESVDQIDENNSTNATSTRNPATTSTNTTTTSTIVAHCGDCGQCSNPHDISIYDATKNSLYQTSVGCARRVLAGGREEAKKCMLENVGLTPGCNECWVDNIMCDLRKCVFTCFFHAIFNNQESQSSSGSSSSSDPQQLNPCTLCDEKRCGQNFLSCAGANRRRTGILSNIERDVNKEVCQKVNPKEWWKDEILQQQWEEQQLHQQPQQQQEQQDQEQEQEPFQRLRRVR